MPAPIDSDPRVVVADARPLTQIVPPPSATMASAQAMQPLLTYLAALEARVAALEGGKPLAPVSASGGAGAGAAGDELSRQTQAFDAFLLGAPAVLAQVSAKIGGDCAVLVRSCRGA